MFAKGENAKALKLQEELTKLSLAQQKQLEERLQDVKSETERQGMIYQFLAVQNNNEMLNKIQSKRYTSYIVLGVGATILALVFVKLAKK
jgi:Zn-finger domain-containing protein